MISEIVISPAKKLSKVNDCCVTHHQAEEISTASRDLEKCFPKNLKKIYIGVDGAVKIWVDQ